MSLNVCTSLLERTPNYIVHLSKWIFIHSLFIVRSGSRISRIDKLILVFLLLSKQSESWTLQSLERKSSFEPRFVTRSEYFSYYTRIYERKTRNTFTFHRRTFYFAATIHAFRSEKGCTGSSSLKSRGVSF